MDVYKLDIIVSALFLIVGAVFYTGKVKSLGLIIIFVSGIFMANGLYQYVADIINSCSIVN